MSLLLLFLFLLPVHLSVSLAFNIAVSGCWRQSFGITLISIDPPGSVVSCYIFSRERDKDLLTQHMARLTWNANGCWTEEPWTHSLSYLALSRQDPYRHRKPRNHLVFSRSCTVFNMSQKWGPTSVWQTHGQKQDGLGMSQIISTGLAGK